MFQKLLFKSFKVSQIKWNPEAWSEKFSGLCHLNRFKINRVWAELCQINRFFGFSWFFVVSWSQNFLTLLNEIIKSFQSLDRFLQSCRKYWLISTLGLDPIFFKDPSKFFPKNESCTCSGNYKKFPMQNDYPLAIVGSLKLYIHFGRPTDPITSWSVKI